MSEQFEDDIERRLQELVGRDRLDLDGLTDLHREAERSLGLDHRLVWEVAAHRSWALAVSGEADRATELIDTVLARASLAEPEGPSVTLLLTRKAGLLSQALDRDDEAALLWEQARRQWRVLEGEQSPRALHAQYEQARCLGWSGDLDAARRVMSEVIDQADDVWRPHGDETLAAMRFQVGTLRRTGEVDEALDLSRQFLARITAAHPDDHELIIETRKQVALIVRERSGPTDALAMLTSLHPDAIAALGESHDETLDIAEEIAFTTGQSGELADADNAYRDLFPVLAAAEGRPLLRAAFVRWIQVLSEIPDDPESTLLDDALRDRIDLLASYGDSRSSASLEACRAWAHHLARQSRFAEALTGFHAIQTDFADVLDTSDALQASIDVATTLRSLGQTREAVATLRAGLVAHPEAADPVRRRAQQALAMALTDLDEGDAAIAIMRELAESGDVSARNDLAVAHVRDDRHSDALAILGQLREEGAGAGTDLELRILGNIALSTCGLGRHTDAAKLWSDLVALQLDRPLADQLDVLRTRHNLAREHLHTGDLERAAQVADRVIADRVRALGADHPLTLTTMSLRAHVAEDVGDLSDATHRFRSLWQARTRVLGADHPAARDTSADLARVLAAAGDDAGSVGVLDQALAQVDADEGTAALHRGELLDQRGRRTDALVEYRKATQHFASTVGDSAPETVSARLAGADILFTLKQHAEAAQEYERVLPYLRAAGNPMVLLRSMGNYSYSLGQLGRRDDAVTVQQEAVEQANAWAPDDPVALTMRSQLGRRLALADDLSAAERIYREVATDRARVLGPDHRDTLDSRSDVAEALLAQGKQAAAAREFKTLVPAMERHLGADSRDTVRAKGFQATAAKGVASSTLKTLGTVAGIAIAILALLVIVSGLIGR